MVAGLQAPGALIIISRSQWKQMHTIKTSPGSLQPLKLFEPKINDCMRHITPGQLTIEVKLSQTKPPYKY